MLKKNREKSVYYSIVKRSKKWLKDETLKESKEDVSLGGNKVKRT